MEKVFYRQTERGGRAECELDKQTDRERKETGGKGAVEVQMEDKRDRNNDRGSRPICV